jgi:integrase/recombinase XerC/integrase/recombinase XerD
MSVVIETFIESLSGRVETTQATYRQELTRFECWLGYAGGNLSALFRSDVQHYLDYLTAQKKSAATVHKAYQAIRSYCRYAGNTNAAENIRLIKLPRTLDRAPRSLNKTELRRILRDINKNGSLRDCAIIVLILNTGLRVGELTALDRSDIKIGDRKGHLTVTWGKNEKTAKLPLNNEARRTLSEYLVTRKDDYPALFVSNRGERISKRAVQHLMERLGVSAHALRHTFITNLIRAGVDISVVQTLSRHASADMVLRYSKPREKDLEGALEKIAFQEANNAAKTDPIGNIPKMA